VFLIVFNVTYLCLRNKINEVRTITMLNSCLRLCVFACLGLCLRVCVCVCWGGQEGGRAPRLSFIFCMIL
jgi:hypothetical protein